MCVLVAQACPTLCDPMDRSPPGSSVHGILQARIPEWVAIPLSKRTSQPGDWTQVYWVAGRFFTIWAIREALVTLISCKLDYFSPGPVPLKEMHLFKSMANVLRSECKANTWNHPSPPVNSSFCMWNLGNSIDRCIHTILWICWRTALTWPCSGFTIKYLKITLTYVTKTVTPTLWYPRVRTQARLLQITSPKYWGRPWHCSCGSEEQERWGSIVYALTAWVLNAITPSSSEPETHS